MKRVVVLLLLIVSFSGYSNTEDSISYRNEFRLVVDNDVFISLRRDRYYSSGIFLYYRKLLSDTNHIKKIRSYSINQRIYTPRSLLWENVRSFDRPYAGHISVFIGNEYYKKNGTYINTKAEIGWMGPASLTGTIQENWHRYLGLPVPQGWEYEIQNSPILNFYGTFAKSLSVDQSADITSETNVALGTAFSHIRQELILRIGKFLPIYSSVYYSGAQGRSIGKNREKKSLEAFFFYAPGIEYNINNTTIEGNWFGKKAPHTEEALRLIFQNKLGFQWSWPSFDVQVIYYDRTIETTEAEKHRYLGLHLNKRF